MIGSQPKTVCVELFAGKCPDCAASVTFSHRQVFNYFSLLFVPLIKLEKVGGYVECSGCNARFAEDALASLKTGVVSGQPHSNPFTDASLETNPSRPAGKKAEPDADLNGQSEPSEDELEAIQLVSVHYAAVYSYFEREQTNLGVNGPKLFLGYLLGVAEAVSPIPNRTIDSYKWYLARVASILFDSGGIEGALNLWMGFVVRDEMKRERLLGAEAIQYNLGLWVNEPPGTILLQSLGIKNIDIHEPSWTERVLPKCSISWDFTNQSVKTVDTLKQDEYVEMNVFDRVVHSTKLVRNVDNITLEYLVWKAIPTTHDEMIEVHYYIGVSGSSLYWANTGCYSKSQASVIESWLSDEFSKLDELDIFKEFISFRSEHRSAIN